MDPMHRVVIIGAGFGGLSAARALANRDAEVTVVDQRNFHTFQPMLYEVSTAGLDPGDVAYPIRAIFGRIPNVRFRYATVTGVDWDARTVALEGAGPLGFDSLVIASGAIANFFGVEGTEEFAHPLYTLADARCLRDHLLRRFEEIDAHPERSDDGTLTFVVVGGGPTGVEVAGALAELLDVSVRHDGFRFDRGKARIIVIDGLERLLTSFKEAASVYTADTLRNRGVELMLGRMVRRVTATGVELDAGALIPTRTVVWAGGVSVHGTVASELGVTAERNGRLVVRADLALPDHHRAYAIGDAAAVPWGPDRPGETCPQLAQVAIQSGRHAAEQILNRIEGRPTVPFRYRDKGIMATIGRRAAVAQFPKGRLIRGTLGWLSWLGLHVVYLIGFRNKVTVLVNWSWRYLSWTSGPRIIVGEDLGAHPDPGDAEQQAHGDFTA
ncbi:MAG: NAD(P)/FAD-dependent oxidoreductase [Acidimicrobiales bacterium]